MYSLANIANGFVQTVEQYAWVRFIAGLGLAGELGVGITLVSEVMTKERRGMGASIVSGIGIIGAVLGFLVADAFDWRIAYYVGGGLGLALLVLRISVYESGMFHRAKEENVKRGDFLSLFTDSKRFLKYLLCILAGVPVWYAISQLAINASAYAKTGLVNGTIVGAQAVTLHYIGASIGSILFGYISERLRSRKKALLLAVGLMAMCMFTYFLNTQTSPGVFYAVIGVMGISMGGLWSIFMVSASEQFGTNLRATVTTTAPNFVRGTTVLISICVSTLVPSIGLLSAGFYVGIVCVMVSLVAILYSTDTYGKDLDYHELS
jgi:MFS family permease